MEVPAYQTKSADPAGEGARHGVTRRGVFGGAAALGLAAAAPGIARAAAPQGQLTWGLHVSVASTWLDPAETQGIITPYMVLYALHDAMVKDMPGKTQAPSLAESWSTSEDHLTHEFVLRPGVKFHDGEPVTAEDVKFSFERYHGTSHALLKEKVAAVEIADPRRIRFKMKEPWPDFLTFYSSATGAGWIVPKKYVEKVGDEGFKNKPIGAGPYKFVSFTPGIELVLEAFDDYWRKPPAVKRLVLKVIPDESTRLAALKRGEIDIAYSVRGELAGELQNTPGLSLKAVVVQGTFSLYFPEQWNPKSPWYDQRVRQAASLAIDRATINQALTQGFSRITGSSVFPDMFEFYWQPPTPEFNPDKAKQLLAQAGLPNGVDAGFYYCDASYANIGEAVLNNLRDVGIAARLRPIERAAFLKGYADKQYKNIIQVGPGAFGNAATRMESLVVKGGQFVYGSYPDIDELFPKQAVEIDRKKREALLHRMQQLAHEKTIYAPIWEL